MKLTFLIAILMFLSGKSTAQIAQDNLELNLRAVHVIVMELSGEVRISHSFQNKITAESTLTPEGSVIGWSFSSKRPPFKLLSLIVNDTLYLRTPNTWDQKVIGVDLYTEKIETSISIPANQEIIIDKANVIMINTCFTDLKIKQARRIIYKNLDNSKFELLVCKALKRLTIGGLNYDREHEVTGTGRGIIILNAENILIN